MMSIATDTLDLVINWPRRRRPIRPTSPLLGWMTGTVSPGKFRDSRLVAVLD